jgi:predicted enzyme related to lactoylglutathione lyase
MSGDGPPSVLRVGGVSYLHIPCLVPSRAADFYEAVFGWEPGRDSDEPAFADGTGHVIGHFVAGEPSLGEGGIRPFVYVEDVDRTLQRIEEHGGTVAASPHAEGSLRAATFRDPEGNLIGVWTETAARHGEPGN